MRVPCPGGAHPRLWGPGRVEEPGWRVAHPCTLESPDNEGAKPRTSIRQLQYTCQDIGQRKTAKKNQAELLPLGQKHRNHLIPKGHKPEKIFAYNYAHLAHNCRCSRKKTQRDNHHAPCRSRFSTATGSPKPAPDRAPQRRNTPPPTHLCRNPQKRKGLGQKNPFRAIETKSLPPLPPLLFKAEVI